MEASSIVSTMLGFGLAGFAGLTLAEKFVPAVPSYVLLMIIGMAVPDGAMLLPTLLATVAGSVAGSLGWYGIGRLLGAERVEALVARYGCFVLLRPALYGRLTQSYRRNQFWVTLVGQAVPTVRVYLGLPAGVLRLDPGPFLLATTLGASVWNVPFVSLGYGLRESGREPFSLGLGAAIALVAAEFAILWLVRAAARFVAAMRREGTPAR